MPYFMDESPDIDHRKECRLTPNQEVSEHDLKMIGVEITKIDFDSPTVEEDLERLVRHYNMNHRDEIRICRATMGDFDTKMKIFFEEHLHDDAELRIIRDGVGYFDVRAANERWIRIPVRRGDFVFLPAGIYHRFTPDTSEDVTAIRLFRENPKWTAFNRSSNGDEQPIREEYLSKIVV